MDPLIVEATKTVALEAIKILGPAAIAVFATYKATRAQFELKLKELDRVHQFTASEHWFNYYKGRQDKLAETSHKLNEDLGQFLGMATAAESFNDTQGAMFRTVAASVSTFSNIAQSEIEATARDVKQHPAFEQQEYEKLLSFLNRLRVAPTGDSFTGLQQSVLLLVEAHQYLERCNETLLKHHMDKSFRKYLHA